MPIDFSLLIGVAGATLILIGFFLVQSHRWNQDELKYDALNACGSILLLVYGWIGHAWPFVVLNAIWAMYSLKDVISDIKHLPQQIRKGG